MHTWEKTAAVVARRAAERTDEIVRAARAVGADAIAEDSRLEGWTRLTILCHLRYGAEASRHMTQDAMAGRPTSYYPSGRDRQRPATLVPGPDETPADVVDSLARESDSLHRIWASLSEDDWLTPVVEPDGNADLGPTVLARLPIMRATEVEVHGTDLDLGLGDWSATFVDAALAMRIDWLNRRRSNHKAVDPDVQGSWLLVTSEGPAYRVAVDGEAVSAAPITADVPADAVIEGSARDLLALLLGRPTRQPLRFAGDVALAQALSRAFPGP